MTNEQLQDLLSAVTPGDWTCVTTVDEDGKPETVEVWSGARLVHEGRYLGHNDFVDAQVIADARLMAVSKSLAEELIECRTRFNDLDLCQEGQAPCNWAMKLLGEIDTLKKELIAVREALAIIQLRAFRQLDIGENHAAGLMGVSDRKCLTDIRDTARDALVRSEGGE